MALAITCPLLLNIGPGLDHHNKCPVGQGQVEITIHANLEDCHTIVKDILYCPQSIQMSFL